MKLETVILIHSKVREWLMTEWDPIGVSRIPEASNEYHGYERGIADLLIGGVSTEELASHLLAQEREQMGLTGDPAAASIVAARIKHHFTELLKAEEDRLEEYRPSVGD